MDEVSTVIYSLGNSSYYLPQDRLVGLADILRPLTATPEASPLDSARFLLAENNHPPLYFMLAHFWMDWFTSGEAIAFLWVARLFSVLWSVASIPIVFWVTRIAFQSTLAGVISAAFMTVSPFGIFLAQEARHYGFAIVLITASLGYFVLATRAVLAYKTPSWRVCLPWVLLNALAFANHYFSALSIAAEGLVLAAIALQQARNHGTAILTRSYWIAVYAVAIGSGLSIVAWLPVLLNFYGSPQTTFLISSQSILRWVNPFVQTLAAIGTVIVTPANFYAKSPWEISLIVLTILITLVVLIRLIPIFLAAAKELSRTEHGQIGIGVIGGFLLTMFLLFALICCGYGADITRGLRYTFTYYPAIVVLIGGIFSICWQQRSPNGFLGISLPLRRDRLSGQGVVKTTWIVSLMSALLVVNNLAFPKFYAPDKFIPFIQENSTHPIVLASTEEIFEEPTVIGAKFLSVAWEIERNFHPENPASGWISPPQFFVLKEGYRIETPLVESFRRVVQNLTGVYDIWVIRSEVDKADPLLAAIPEACTPSTDAPQGNKASYSYIHLVCDLQP
jgi:uncharacterized membrane protein